MRIYLEASTEALELELRSILRAHAHEIDDDAKHALVLLIDDGFEDVLARIALARAVQPAIEPVLIIQCDNTSGVTTLVTDFILLPIVPEELLARLDRITMRRINAGTRHEDLLAKAVEATGDVIEITDPSSKLLYVNPAFEEILGFTAEEAIGKTPAQLFRSSMHAPEYFQKIEDVVGAGRAWKGLLICRRLDDRLVYLDSVIAPVHDTTGRETHRIAVKRDVTAQKVAEAELRASNEALSQARDAAIEASRIKSQFVANMSHELRTPLNAILGYAEMVEEEIEDLTQEEIVEDIARIRKAGLHLLSLVNDVLDMSKIEAGHTELHLEELELEPLLSAVMQTMDPLVNERRNELLLRFDCKQPRAHTDLVKLRQCVLNLVSNANKFTEQGRITIHAKDAMPPRGRRGEWIEVAIIDSGIGMSEEEQQRLFQPFVQADTSTTRRFGGTGLGLHISQRFCEMLGGHISVTSAEGKGSTFTMHLPRRVGQSERSGRDGPIDPSESTGRGSADLRPQVLLIDDDRVQHNIVERELHELGYELIAVDHGAQGLAQIKVDRPDLILLDVLMPGMDGWTVLETLMADPATREIPVVMLSVVDDHSRADAIGAKAFLSKPVNRIELAQVLHEWAPTVSGRLMVIDDDEVSSSLVRQSLELAGHRVELFADATRALCMVKKAPPDLILLDLLMPGMDGFDFLEQLRELPGCKQLPVVVTTGKVLDRDELFRLQHAAAHVVSKNAYSSAELVEVVARQLERAALNSASASSPS